GSLQSKQSVVTMTMFDIRSGVQLSVSEGNATATNFGAALGALTGSAAGGMGGFSRTHEGKATVAAFMDAYNNMVISLRNYKAQEVQGGLGRGGQLKVGNCSTSNARIQPQLDPFFSLCILLPSCLHPPPYQQHQPDFANQLQHAGERPVIRVTDLRLVTVTIVNDGYLIANFIRHPCFPLQAAG